MLLPMGPAGGLATEGPPEEVKDKHTMFWWALVFLHLTLCVVNAISGDIFGLLFAGIMTLVVWYLASDKCAKMSQYCLFMFGVMCVIQCVIETVVLLQMVQGREIKHMSSELIPVDGNTNKLVHTTVVERHDFFEQKMGISYNAQSALRIISPIIMLSSALLARWSYNKFPRSLFDPPDVDGESGPMLGDGGRLGGGFGQGFGGGYGGGAPPSQGHGGGRAVGGPTLGRGQGNVHVFEGSGHRLGS